MTAGDVATGRPGPGPGGRVRAPKVADVLADRLRADILSGNLADGDRLPAQDDLLATYGVGRSSLREALRVLETEGLISIQRGNVGGSVVHRPTEEYAAYTLGMVLQSESVALLEVAKALRLLEPLCVEQCALREDRATTVVPALRAAHDAALATVDNELVVNRESRRFHEILASQCGNRPLGIVVGILESLWSTHELNWAAEATETGQFPEREERTRALEMHGRMLEYIERGDAEKATREAREHLLTSTLYAMSGEARPTVRVTGRRA